MTTKQLISEIYKRQKQYIINKRHIRMFDDKDCPTDYLEKENIELTRQIEDLQKQLKINYLTT